MDDTIRNHIDKRFEKALSLCKEEVAGCPTGIKITEKICNIERRVDKVEADMTRFAAEAAQGIRSVRDEAITSIEKVKVAENKKTDKHIDKLWGIIAAVVNVTIVLLLMLLKLN